MISPHLACDSIDHFCSSVFVSNLNPPQTSEIKWTRRIFVYMHVCYILYRNLRKVSSE
jgi:hypothetical protein